MDASQAVIVSRIGQVETPQSSIGHLEGKTVRLMLRDTTVLQGRLERIGWTSNVGESISYLSLKLDDDSVYVLSAQGINTRSGLLFIPWDHISCVVAP